MFNNETVMDHIRPDTLFTFIRDVYRESREPARFLYEGDGLRIITDDDTLLNDWSPRQVEQALRDLEVAGKVAVAYRVAGPRRTSIVDYHVAAYPLKSVRPAKEWGQVRENLSVAELTERVRTDDEFCATLIQHIYLQSESFNFLACYRTLVYEDYILYHRIFFRHI
jgi:hypothetical protein